MNQIIKLLLIASMCILAVSSDDNADLKLTENQIYGIFKKQFKQCITGACSKESCITDVNLKGYCLVNLCIDSTNYKDPKTLVDCIPLKIDDSSCNSGMDDAEKQVFSNCFNQQKTSFKTTLSSFNIEVERKKILLQSAFIEQVRDCLNEQCNNDVNCSTGAYEKGACLIDLCTTTANYEDEDAAALGQCLGSKQDDAGCNDGQNDATKKALTECLKQVALFSKIIGLSLMSIALLLMI